MRIGFIESFNNRMRDELLNVTMFRTIAHAPVVIRTWAADYDPDFEPALGDVCYEWKTAFQPISMVDMSQEPAACSSYLVNFLYFTRVGFTLSGPSRRILSAS